MLEENTLWENKAELHIDLIEEAVCQDMRETNCPLALWDCCVEHHAHINNLTAKDLFQLHGSNAHTTALGKEGNISNICQFGF